MASFSQTNRILTFTSPLGANTLLPMSFRGTEEISELFDFSLELLAVPEVFIDPSALIGRRVTLSLQIADTGTLRHFNGIVASFEGTGGDSYFNSYHLRMVPMLWLPSLNQQTRVFQNKTVVDIVKDVLEPYSIVPRVETQQSYVALEYCTQYRETDLDFVSRILQQHGIFYYFTHTVSDHTMVLSDAASHLSDCPIVSRFRYATIVEEQQGFYEPMVYGFSSRSTLVTGEHTSWDYRFMLYALSHASPQSANSSTPTGQNSHEVYDYADSASALLKTESGDRKTQQLQTSLQNVAKEITEARSIRCSGTSTASTMQAGFAFTLTDYPQTEMNIKYLVTRVEHFVEQHPGYRSEVSAGTSRHPYTNTFSSRPFTQPWRKERTLPKPRVNGVVTGKVVTPAGDDSYMDKYGRVCVQFWWDRHRPPNTPDNTLLRVVQQWAGRGWGTYFWPRAGDEVLIDFLDGDPDAPIVVGSVYNGVNMPKYDPQSDYTLSGILTRSSKDGGVANANELRFNDRMGSEQIFMNAERDFDLHVEHDWHTLIGNEEHRKITSNQYHSVGGDAQLKIAQSRTIEVDGDATTSVRGDYAESIGGNYSVSATARQIQKSGIAHVIEAGEEVHISGKTRVIIDSGVGGICLKGPLGAISIDLTGITLQGPVHFGVADCLPPAPDPAFPDIQEVTAPEWPGDAPRGQTGT
jgi:type VI secretion system secreted protein VgrG